MKARAPAHLVTAAVILGALAGAAQAQTNDLKYSKYSQPAAEHANNGNHDGWKNKKPKERYDRSRGEGRRDVVTVPEPGTLVMFAGGLVVLALAGLGRRRKSEGARDT